jgi:hypothetical protein
VVAVADEMNQSEAEQSESDVSSGADCRYDKKPGITHAEAKAVTMLIVSFVIIATVEVVLSLVISKIIPGFTGKYWQYLVYITISVAFGGAAIWYVCHYKRAFDCTMGMMVGMTIGMLAGFVFGAIIGATNGMFIGSVYGMAVGMFVGASVVCKCGIMSVMEGLMAGFMGGLMGAMTTVMMISDNLALFMPIVIGGCSVILYGMMHMIVKETEKKSVQFDAYDTIIFASALVILAFATTALMAFGPKSAIVGL